MATMIPILSSARLGEIQSCAEVRVYEAFRKQLPSDCLVLFEVPFIGTGREGNRFDGACDFIIVRPDWGILVVEVKGGGVRFNAKGGYWESIDRYRKVNQIKDPFRQATEQAHSIRRFLEGDPAWSRAQPQRVIVGHAVLMPDIDVRSIRGPHIAPEILGGLESLADTEAWLEGVNNFWTRGERVKAPLLPGSIEIVKRVLTTRAEALPVMASQLNVEERQRIQLTAQQSRVLKSLGNRSQALICGGAGTGKTILAIERAQELAIAGKKTLLVCYNTLLSQQMQATCGKQPGLLVTTFHQLCRWYIDRVKAETGEDVMAMAWSMCVSQGLTNQFDDISPLALLLGTMTSQQRFDAIVVDEGQDFRQNYWDGLTALLVDQKRSDFYIFFDPNQALYQINQKLPINDEPFYLTFNCRNTQSIHDFAYRHYRGRVVDPPPGLEGVPIEAISEDGLQDQMQAIHRSVSQLILNEKLKPSAIAVLVCGQPKTDYYPLQRLRLPNGTSWSVEGGVDDLGVRLDTVRRFKGLEADFVFLWGLESMKHTDREEVLYVGATRAKSRLVIVGAKHAVRKELGTAI